MSDVAISWNPDTMYMDYRSKSNYWVVNCFFVTFAVSGRLNLRKKRMASWRY